MKRPPLARVRTVTPVVWPKPGKQCYGNPATYALAASWLDPCATIADWGGGAGFFRRYLDPARHQYTLIDGTDQGVPGQVFADLADFRQPSDGIMIRHVVDMTPDWRRVLDNVLVSYRHRAVIVTWTPFSDGPTRVERYISGWPVWNFAPGALVGACGPELARSIACGAEWVYCLERR